MDTAEQLEAVHQVVKELSGGIGHELGFNCRIPHPPCVWLVS